MQIHKKSPPEHSTSGGLETGEERGELLPDFVQEIGGEVSLEPISVFAISTSIANHIIVNENSNLYN